MLKGKTIVLGVTGSIAAYKMANVASMLVKRGCEVHVVMTKNATHFINPIAFESLTNTKCLVETFDRNFQFHVAHVSLTDKADAMLIAPASANIIGKIANGIADDMLSTTVMACNKPVIISPAMNTKMFNNPILQDNLDKLRRFGYEIVQPATGHLACGTSGAGKMPSEEVLVAHLERAIAKEKDLKGKKVLVTAGPTIEAIDPVRYISNHSSGKMGYAIAGELAARGAEVTLVTGRTALPTPAGVTRCDVLSAEEMYRAATAAFDRADGAVMCAAVADYTPETCADRKLKKGDGELTIRLRRTKDIAAELGSRKGGRVLVGFALETDDEEAHAREKLRRKHFDYVVLNSLRDAGAGFRGDTNKVTFVSESGNEPLPLLAKREVAARIADKIETLINE